ncbi:MAG TPA: hypothetical protein VKB49_09830 [Candidatus Sulfotelmatobacter sp.]|nr:hypothetical protein [Candidatus Sulfotelmatobacter sp.]
MRWANGHLVGMAGCEYFSLDFRQPEQYKVAHYLLGLGLGLFLVEGFFVA